MFDAQELIDRFRDLVQEDASDTRRRKLIHSYYRQITLQDVDPDRKLYDRYLKAGRKALIRYLKGHPFKIRMEEPDGSEEWLWFRTDLFTYFIEQDVPRGTVKKALEDKGLRFIEKDLKQQFRALEPVHEALSSPVTGYLAQRLIEGHIRELEALMMHDAADELVSALTEEEKVEILSESHSYTGEWTLTYQRYKFLKEQTENVRRQITDRIPENPIDLYPNARALERHFILHVGPTNSGKTHDSLIRFRAAEKAIYLAPLRLMANEIYDQTNRLGVLCNMETGEEHILLEGAEHTACTIELLNPQEYFDVAVIDEAQMMEDQARGGNWTQAILGVCAPEIHVCMAPYAEQLAIRLIELCSDTYEVVRHERAVPLRLDSREFRFPEDVEKGDALIVFSKKSVLYVAAELRARNVSTSVIYGALPYDVRSNEVERFASGQTDVVVATDAIGMGLNLPIRRIVFLENNKFDGMERRDLKPAEIQQIAGRAGRYGQFEIGLYTSEFGKREVRKAYHTQVEDLTKAYLKFPRTLISIPSPISVLLEQWASMENPGLFWKGNIDEEIKLCRELEEMSDDKLLIYDFAMIPFDTDDPDLHDIWLELFSIAEAGDDTYNILHYLAKRPYAGMELDDLEHEHKKIGLLLYYSWKHSITEYSEALLERKHQVCDEMIRQLSRQNYSVRTCPDCGRRLAWNWPYRLCNDCFEKEGNGRYRERRYRKGRR